MKLLPHNGAFEDHSLSAQVFLLEFSMLCQIPVLQLGQIVGI